MLESNDVEITTYSDCHIIEYSKNNESKYHSLEEILISYDTSNREISKVVTLGNENTPLDTTTLPLDIASRTTIHLGNYVVPLIQSVEIDSKLKISAKS
jgi:hypothetical protein